MDGDCYEGKEDHVWMDIEPFEDCMFNEHCYMGMCIANVEWREEM